MRLLQRYAGLEDGQVMEAAPLGAHGLAAGGLQDEVHQLLAQLGQGFAIGEQRPGIEVRPATLTFSP